METTQRPAPVTLLSVLAFTFGVLGTLTSLSIVTGVAYVAANGNEVGGLLLYGMVLGALSMAQVAFGYGAWTRKPWTWTLGVGVQISTIALTVLFLVLGSELSRQLLAILPASAMLALLLVPSVKQALGKV